MNIYINRVNQVGRSREHKKFKFPPTQSLPAPLWFWNHLIKPEELLLQIRMMKAKRIGGFVIHARLGLLTPYLGDEWLQLCCMACEEARRQGMIVWLYDEKNWPSGTCAGQVMEENPEYSMTVFNKLDEFTVSGPERIKREYDTKEQIISAWAVQRPLLKDLRRNLKENKLEVSLEKGEWRVCVIRRKRLDHNFLGVRGYVDTLNPKAIEEFLRLTHLRYAKELKKYFGDPIAGIFTDEPTANFDSDPTSIAYSPVLVDKFKRRYGYSIIDKLPALYEDLKESTKVRCDYYRLVAEQYADTFFLPIQKWCERNKIRSIGHVHMDGEFYEQLRQQGDFFKTMERMHYSGIDYLFEQTWATKGFPRLNNLVACKLGSSAAHLYGHERAMSEAFGVAAAWEITPRTLKWMTDFHAALGINYFIPHGFFYTIEGFRKIECVPSLFFQATYWRYFEQISNYIGRLCEVLSSGRHVARVAVLYPNRTGWSLIRGRDKSAIWSEREEKGPVNELEISFNNTLQALTRIHYDYDILPEEALWKAKIHADGSFQPQGSNESYEALILSNVTVLEKESITFLKKLNSRRGKILVLGKEPAVDTAGTKIAPINGKRLLKWREASLRKFLDDRLGAELLLESDSGENLRDLVLYRFRKPNGDFLLVVNTSRERGYRGSMSIKGSWNVEQWDLDSGEIGPYHNSWSNSQRETRIEIDLPPVASLLILTSPTVRQVELSSPVPFTKVIWRDRGPWKFFLEKENALPLDKWEYRTLPSRSKGVGWPYLKHEYRTIFHAREIPAKARLLLDGIWNWFDGKSGTMAMSLFVNGKRINKWEKGKYIDPLIREASVQEYIKHGVNEIKLVSESGSGNPHPVPVPLILIGDFLLDKNDKLTALRSPLVGKDWTKCGAPYYAGTGTYKMQVKLKSQKSGKLWLEITCVEDCVEPIWNGSSLGVRMWEPYRWELTHNLSTNLLEIRVTNRLANLIMKKRLPSGLLGEIRIASVLCLPS